MSENWIAFLAGAAWLAVFTAGLFAFANWVQRRDRRQRNERNRARYDQGITTSDRPERKGGA
ncbi:hypothetical protein LV476_04855 [Guyparkeria hydrothermalis]|uniref:hypothetical protein n=1 Tax=Guyparkeria hydrothermalis TaxID=923 RepID=UPI00202098DE|nr:hypothetical protein [Guyparkeria hydrothermalis]MCL7744281.1 hypothetical protein [Guyparkeria hydrothermalis]